MMPSASLPRNSGTIAPGWASYHAEQPVPEAGEAEEVVLLLELVDGRLVDRAQAAWQQLVVGVVRLAAHAVLAAVVVELDVAGVVAALQQLGDRGVVARFGGADEVVVGDVEAAPRRGEARGDPVGELLRSEPRRGRRLLDLLAVLVGAGEELDVVAEQAVPAGERVADDRRVGVADVRFVVDVVDRRRRVEPAHRLHATSAPTRNRWASRRTVRSCCSPIGWWGDVREGQPSGVAGASGAGSASARRR